MPNDNDSLESAARLADEWGRQRGAFAVECERDGQHGLAERWRIMADTAHAIAREIRALVKKETTDARTPDGLSRLTEGEREFIREITNEYDRQRLEDARRALGKKETTDVK